MRLRLSVGPHGAVYAKEEHMNRTIILISVAGLSLLIIGAERTMGCVLGSTLAILVNGMLANKPADGVARRPDEMPPPKDTNRDVGADSWKTPAILETTPMTVGAKL
jgi:hypothetical protein